MTQPSQLPEYVNQLSPTEAFDFACHSKVQCFTDCCRMLELALTPYDALRLRLATHLHSEEILDKYIIVEQDADEPFPRFYLTMVDDGRASCVFVSANGCTIYPHRPGACRSYPLGRGAARTDSNTIEEHFVLMREKHCHGFKEPDSQNALQYLEAQGMNNYNRFNDCVAQILQHQSIRQGFIPSSKQIEFFTLALYNIDTFRDLFTTGKLDSTSTDKGQIIDFENDEQLLQFSISWLQQQLFSL